jgi:8-oxo-dGTP diphosphatase
MKTIHVVAGVVQFGAKTLCVQRAQHKFSYISEKWEFPGGKVEDGESEQEALVRELKEELHLSVSELKHLITVDHTYPDFRIIMSTYKCASSSETVVLTEHQKAEWLDLKDLSHKDWAAADVPIVNALLHAK